MKISKRRMRGKNDLLSYEMVLCLIYGVWNSLNLLLLAIWLNDSPSVLKLSIVFLDVSKQILNHERDTFRHLLTQTTLKTVWWLIEFVNFINWFAFATRIEQHQQRYCSNKSWNANHKIGSNIIRTHSLCSSHAVPNHITAHLAALISLALPSNVGTKTAQHRETYYIEFFYTRLCACFCCYARERKKERIALLFSCQCSRSRRENKRIFIEA